MFRSTATRPEEAAMPRKLLNIYLLTRTDDVDYEQDEAVVVVAANPDDARQMAGGAVWYLPTTTVGHIGKARPDVRGGVVLVANRGA
jgi:hypothetical protein